MRAMLAGTFASFITAAIAASFSATDLHARSEPTRPVGEEDRRSRPQRSHEERR
jgi:hypothetical protein